MKGITQYGNVQKNHSGQFRIYVAFRYDDYDYQRIPYLLITTKAFPKATLHINFPIKDHFLLNSGLPRFSGTASEHKLNQPLFVSQIIQQCSKQIDLSNLTGYHYLNGLDILKTIGYELFW